MRNLKLVARTPPKKMNKGDISKLETAAMGIGCREDGRNARQLAAKKLTKTRANEPM
jgi:hypothetical protein